MINDMIEFLRARLDEDEQAAELADGEFVYFEVDHTHTALHYQRHDPARVLREVEAKRRMLELHQPSVFDTKGPDGEDREGVGCPSCLADTAPCATLHLLALPYADHPDYREEWRP